MTDKPIVYLYVDDDAEPWREAGLTVWRSPQHRIGGPMTDEETRTWHLEYLERYEPRLRLDWLRCVVWTGAAAWCLGVAGGIVFAILELT